MYVFAVATGVSSIFTVGAGLEDPHSFGFALYVGGTVAAVLCFLAAWREA